MYKINNWDMKCCCTLYLCLCRRVLKTSQELGEANVVEEGPVSINGVYLWLLTSSDQCDCVMHLCLFRSMAQKQVWNFFEERVFADCLCGA
jgi:hypothetical protein